MKALNLHGIAPDSLVLPTREVAILLGSSVGMGIVLMLLSIWCSSKISKASPNIADKGESIADIVQNAANYLFICVGMTAVMMLVANNLARAFAIGAAMSLIRFRIKMDKRAVGTSMLFAVLTGMACGVDEVKTAFSIMGIAVVLQVVVAHMVCRSFKVDAAATMDQPHPIIPMNEMRENLKQSGISSTLNQ